MLSILSSFVFLATLGHYSKLDMSQITRLEKRNLTLDRRDILLMSSVYDAFLKQVLLRLLIYGL